MKKNIAVITGGDSAEAGVALNSAAVVCKHLNKERYNVYKIIMEGKNWRDEASGECVDKNDFTLTIAGTKINFDCAFIAIHGTPAEDGKLLGYFEMMGVPFNTCGTLQAALTFNKNMCKEYLAPFGIQMAKGIMIHQQDGRTAAIEQIKSAFSFPVFVKPNNNGSSYGASKVDEENQLEAALDLGFQYDHELIVEEYIAGTEVSNGIMIYKGNVTPMPITEIRSKKAFFDYEAKYENQSVEITPAEIDAEVYKKIQQTSVFIYTKLGFRGLCRIDYILKGNDFYLLEVNSMPGLSEASLFPQQAKVFGLSLEEVFGETIEDALARV